MIATRVVEERPEILYVDADDDAASVLEDALARCGAVHRCRTLDETRAWLRGASPILCVLDPDTPDGDALALVDELRRREPWVQLFVICAPRHAASTALFIAAGANDIAVKPFDVGTLPKRVSRLARAAARAMEEHQQRLELESKVRHADRIAALGVLCATVAHEVASPLQVINLNADLLRDGACSPGDATLAEIGDEIRVAGRIIDTMIGRIRNFSRPADEVRLEAELGAVVEMALLLVRPRVAQRRARVTMPRGPGPRASHYPTALAQALMNVIANAIETRSTGASVEVRFVEQDAAVGVEVVDDGPGLPKEIETGAAGIFFTTKPDGTGLGLHMVRRVLSDHGGRFVLAPRGDGVTGARATLLLPRDPASPLAPIGALS